MNDNDQRYYQRAQRVQTFGTQNSADFTPASKAAAGFANLGQLITRLEHASAGQKPARASKTTLFDSLHTDLLNISRTAQDIAHTENGFAAPYLLPTNPSQGNLLTHADAVLLRLEDQPGDTPAVATAKNATRAKFIAYEIPADFVTHLRADRDLIKTTSDQNEVENETGVENTKLIDVLLGQINQQIVQLNAIMNNKYAAQPEKLRGWQSASHVERAPRKKTDDTPVNTPTTPGPK